MIGDSIEVFYNAFRRKPGKWGRLFEAVAAAEPQRGGSLCPTGEGCQGAIECRAIRDCLLDVLTGVEASRFTFEIVEGGGGGTETVLNFYLLTRLWIS